MNWKGKTINWKKRSLQEWNRRQRPKLNITSIYHGEGNGTPLQSSCLENPMDGVAEGRTQLSDFTFTFHFHALEKEMVTHSSILAWRIPGTGEPCGLPSMGSHRVGHDWSDLAAAASIKPLLRLPGGPAVKTLHFHHRWCGLDPWRGNQDPTLHVARQKKKGFIVCFTIGHTEMHNRAQPIRSSSPGKGKSFIICLLSDLTISNKCFNEGEDKKGSHSTFPRNDSHLRRHLSSVLKDE